MARGIKVLAVAAWVLIAACAHADDEPHEIWRIPYLTPDTDIPSALGPFLRSRESSVVALENSSVLTSRQPKHVGAVSLAAMELDAADGAISLVRSPSVSEDRGSPGTTMASDGSADSFLESSFDWHPLPTGTSDTTTRETQNFELLPPVQIEDQQVEPQEMFDDVATDATPVASDSQGRDGFLHLPPLLMPEVPEPYQLTTRIGWWNVGSDGDPTKIGEFQSLRSSPFWDVDGLFTNGWETFDFYANGLDNEANQTGFRYWKPGFSSHVEYQRFLRRLDHNPLDEFTDFDQQPPDPLPPAPQNFRVMKEDLNVGEDYAIRVQQLDTTFEGRLTDRVKWRLKIWGMRKNGERQANAMAHCFTASNATDANGNPVTGVSCHVVSQRQQIDWLTMEAEPALEGRFGPATVEYSRTMRFFSQDDQLVTRPYDNFGFSGDLPYGLVPDNYTEIDRLKVGVNWSHRRNAYALLYNGNTLNRFRDTNRRFRGLDLRFTDRSVDGVSLTGYFKKYWQTGQDPGFLLPLETSASIRSPIDYDRTTVGLRARWRPFLGDPTIWNGLSWNGGYEFRELERRNAVFAEDVLTVDQSPTTANRMHLRAAMRWSPQLDSFIRYRFAFIDDPLFGVPIRNTATNTNLPTQEHLVEIGSTWAPVNTFLLSTSFGINNTWNISDIAFFQEDSYPITFTAWYAPTPCWTVSGGLAFFSNWIDQDITLGSKSDPVTLPWRYAGRSDVVNIGTTYGYSPNLTLSGSIDFVRGSNTFKPACDYCDLAPLSDVIVETTRFMAGIDYEINCCINSYFRYQFFDYEDKSEDFNSGTAHMVLGGVSAIY